MNLGVNDTGAFWQIFTRGGGQYLGESYPVRSAINSNQMPYTDQGACDLMIEGKIKVKSDTQIAKYTKTGILFEDGTELKADVVVLATG